MGDALLALKEEDRETCKIKGISSDSFEMSVDEAQNWASSVGYMETNTNEIVKAVRARRRGRYNSPGKESK